MFPVLAEHEVFVINQRRQQRLADGEHARRLRAPATGSGAPSSTGRGPTRAWQGITVRAPIAFPRPSARTTAILALIAANVIWGTTFVATKPMLDRIPPLTVAAGRFAVALLILLPLVLRAGGRPTLGKTPALLGFTGVFLLYVTQNVGLDFSSATNGALIHAGIPVAAALLAAPVLGERLDRRRLGGILASIAGVAAVMLLGRDAGLGLAVLGDGLLLVSAVALGAYLVLGRRAFPGGGSLALVAGVACYGLLFLLPVSALELAVQGMARPTGADLLGLLYLGAVASALAFVLWAHGLRHLEAGQAAVFANLTPIVGVLVAALLLGETVSSVQLGGGLVILVGVWLVARQPPPAKPMAARAVPPAADAAAGGTNGLTGRQPAAA